MSWHKIGAKEKRQITADWQKLFPEFGPYKPMWLLRRWGPLVAGVHLETTTENYRILCHLHNLLRPFPTISLSHYRRIAHEYVHWEWHPEKHLRMAERLRQENPVLLGSDVSLAELSRAYGAPFDEDLALLRDGGDYSEQLAFHGLEKIPMGELVV